MNGSADNGDIGQDYLSPSRRLEKGKGRATDDVSLAPPSPATEPPDSPIIDEEAEEREAKLVQENLRRMSELEKNRRASRRRNAASVTVTPPLAELGADLTRRGSKLLYRARTRRSADAHSRQSSFDSSSSSFEAYRSPSRQHQTSLGSLAEVQEAGSPLTIDTAAKAREDDTLTFVDTPTSIDNVEVNAARASRIGSRFAEDIASTVHPAAPDLSRPHIPSRPSAYSLHSIASTATAMPTMGLYSQPLAQESSARLVGDADSFAAGYQRPRQVSVPWYEAVFCCACWGGETDEDEQDGRTGPAYGLD